MPFLEPVILTAFLSVYFYYLCYKHHIFARFGRPNQSLNYSQLYYLGISAFCPALFFFTSFYLFDPYLPSDLELHPEGIASAPFIHHLGLCLILHLHVLLLRYCFNCGRFTPVSKDHQ